MKSQTLKIPKLSSSDLPLGEVKNLGKNLMSAMPAREKRRITKGCKVGSPSERLSPPNAPHWAVKMPGHASPNSLTEFSIHVE